MVLQNATRSALFQEKETVIAMIYVQVIKTNLFGYKISILNKNIED